jgi:hypothetical protein
MGSDVTDAELRYLEDLTELDWLCLADTTISDAGLEHIARISRLQWLTLTNTKVTPAGIEKLQQALPNCTIMYYIAPSTP